MKVLLLVNRITWTSELNKKVENIKKFFAPLGQFDFTIEKTNFNPPAETFIDSNGNPYQAINETWYDTNVSIPSRDGGFNIVALLIPSSDWTGGNVQGYGTPTDCGIQEIVVLANRTGDYVFNGVSYVGDQLTHILQHEIIHRLYDFYNLPDNTHKYYALGTPEKCLEEIKQGMIPKALAILIRQPSDTKQTLGNLIAVRNGEFMMCKTLELLWNNNILDKSCIPTGTYQVVSSPSPKFQKSTYEIKGVPNRAGIRIHAGNYHTDILGCILLGDSYTDLNKDGELDIINSRATVDKFEAFFKKEPFTLTII